MRLINVAQCNRGAVPLPSLGVINNQTQPGIPIHGHCTVLSWRHEAIPKGKILMLSQPRV